MSGVVYPPRDLPGKAEVWGRKVEEVSKALQKAQDQLSQLVSNSNRSTSGQLAVLAKQIETLTAQQQYLFSLQSLDTIEDVSSRLVGQAAWMSNPPTLKVRSATGRIEIQYGGSGNNGSGYFGYQVVSSVLGTIVSRTSVINNPAKRVAVSGGVSFAPSGFTTDVVEVPPDLLLDVSLEVYGVDTPSNSFYFIGGKLSVRTAPGSGSF